MSSKPAPAGRFARQSACRRKRAVDLVSRLGTSPHKQTHYLLQKALTTMQSYLRSSLRTNAVRLESQLAARPQALWRVRNFLWVLMALMVTANTSWAQGAGTATAPLATPTAVDSAPSDAPAEVSDEAPPAGSTTAPARASDAVSTKAGTDVPSNATEPRAKNRMVTVSKASVLVGSFTVFLLAVFVGFEIIAKVPPTLHTPLMSGSNAISGITVVGAMLTAGAAATTAGGWFGTLLGLVAVVLAMINVVGGFVVTHRMLKMFKKR